MKRKWSLRLGAAVLCAVLLGSCGGTAAAPAESTAPADPLTGQQLLYPEQRAAAVHASPKKTGRPAIACGNGEEGEALPEEEL